MVKVFTAHKVKDYDDWKIKYDADIERRKEAGFEEGGHFHNASDHNSFLIVWNTDATVEDAKATVSAMYSDPNLLALMKEGGVYVEEIEFWVSEG